MNPVVGLIVKRGDDLRLLSLLLTGVGIWFILHEHMKSYILIMVAWILPLLLYSQSKPKQYVVKIFNNNGNDISGILYKTADSTITVLADNYGLPDTVTINYLTIERIKYARKYKMVKVLGIAVLTGATVGYIIGRPSPGTTTDYNFDFSGPFAVIGALVAAPIGLVVGAIKETIYINGNCSKFTSVKNFLMEMSLVK